MILSEKLNFEALTNMLALDQAGQGLHKISPLNPAGTRHRNQAEVRRLLKAEKWVKDIKKNSLVSCDALKP